MYTNHVFYINIYLDIYFYLQFRPKNDEKRKMIMTKQLQMQITLNWHYAQDSTSVTVCIVYTQ